MRLPASLARGQSLATRLLFLLTLALLPLGLIALYQTISVVNEARTLAERDILARTERAANAESALVRRAFGAGFALGAAALETGLETPGCDAVMRRFVAQSEAFIFAGFIAPDGVMHCSSGERTMDFSADPDRLRFTEAPRPMVTVNRRGEVTGESIIIVSVPIRGEDDTLLGAVSLSIPHVLSDRLLDANAGAIAIAIADADGTILSANTGIGNAARFAALPATPAALVDGGSGTTVRLPGARGRAGLMAVVPLVDGRLYVLGTWAETPARQAIALFGTAAPAFPVAMWVASLFVAFFAVDRQVLRHLKRLRARMTGFSLETAEKGRVRLDEAPAELAEIAESYNAMVDRIVAGRAEIEASVREKELLLKEVHHRVKNNLQLITSLLNMQIRATRSEEARRVMRRVQDRVMSLATIHKTLYTDEQVAAVRADRIIAEIAQGILSMGMPARSRVRSEFDLAPVALDPDQAVPLSLLVTEAVTNASKYVGRPAEGEARIWLGLREEAGDAVLLTVGNTRPEAGDAGPPSESGTGLGARLIEAFVSQIGGTLEIEDTPETYAIRVRFARRAPSPGDDAAV